MDNEMCENCGRVIGRLEKPCVFDRNIVCFECDQRLRRQANTITPTAPVMASPVATAEDTKPKSSNSGCTGVCIAFSIITILITLIILMSVYQHHNDKLSTLRLRSYGIHHPPDYMAIIVAGMAIAITFALIGLALKTKDGEK